MSITSPIDGATYTYNLTDPPPANLRLGHTINISVQGTRTSSEDSLFTLKRSLHVDGTSRTNEALDLEFGAQLNKTWSMNIEDFGIFFSPKTSTSGQYSSTVYAQVFLGQTAVTSITSKTSNYTIQVNPHKE